MENIDYLNPFYYNVPSLNDSFKLKNYQAVWEAIDELADESKVVPNNKDELIKAHEKKLESLLKKGYLKKLSDKTFADNGYHKHFILLDALKKNYYLGLTKYGYDVSDYFKRIRLHEIYLEIAKHCADLYPLSEFNHIELPEPEKIISKKGEVVTEESQNKIEELNKQKERSKSLLFILKFKNEINRLDNYITSIENNAFIVRNYKPEQAMKIFLNNKNEIEIASITFLKKVITYNLQQQKDKRKEHNKKRRANEDKERKRKLLPKSTICFLKVYYYYTKNPDSSLKLAVEKLGMDPATIRNHRKKMN